jgi:DNA-binding CsgD family transcriptional regulator
MADSWTMGVRKVSRSALTARERQITLLVARGMTNREIAVQFSISENTLRNQLHNIFRKLEVHNRLELVLCAVSRQLLLPPD